MIPFYATIKQSYPNEFGFFFSGVFCVIFLIVPSKQFDEY